MVFDFQSETLIEVMTTYSNSLELVISERTADLMAEKEASDTLLTDELKLGNNPIPELFNCITLYFR